MKVTQIIQNFLENKKKTHKIVQIKKKNLILKRVKKDLKIEFDLSHLNLKNIVEVEIKYFFHISYLIFQVKIGTNVASKNDKNNNDCDTNSGKRFTGNNIPTNIDFEKSGLGKNNNPITNPIIIDIYAFFSLIDFLKKL